MEIMKHERHSDIVKTGRGRLRRPSSRRGTMRHSFLYILGLAMCFLLAGECYAQVYVDEGASPGGNGDSWGTAYTTIQDGIDDADTLDEEVWVAEGTYPESITIKDGVAVYGGFDGTETLLSQRDVETNVATIDASTTDGGNPADHAVVMDNITNGRIDGFTITGGHADGPNPHDLGGGVYCADLDDTNIIANCIITGNSGNYCGGLYCRYSSPTITNCTINNNSSGHSSGGVYCYYSSPALVNCTIAGNSSDHSGGGMSCSHSSPTVTNCIIASNRTGIYHGGGIKIMDDSSPTLENCVISGNSVSQFAGGGGGGGVFVSYCSATLVNCTISGNSSGYGGGVYCESASPTITNCTISSNSVGQESGGGGVLCRDWSHPTITNCLFYNNAQHAVHEYYTNCDPTVTNCLFYGNPDGDYYDEGLSEEAALYTGANAINTNVPEASDNVSGDPLFVMSGPSQISGTWTSAPSFDSATNSTTMTDSAAVFTPDVLAAGLINVNTGQQFQALIKGNTGTTVVVVGDLTGVADAEDPYQIIDYHLRDGSSAVDNGDLATAPATDFEGDGRPGTDGLVDIGVDEADSAFLPPADTTDPVSRVEGLPAAVTTPEFEVPYVASDDQSGLKYVELFYSKEGGDWTQYGGTYTSSPISFDSSTTGGDGGYEFYTVATDNADNAEAAPGSADDATVVLTSFASAQIHVDVNGVGVQNGADWPTPLREIEAAFIVADTFGVSEIWVAQGTYAMTITMPSNLSLYGGFDGTETLLSGRDVEANVTTVDASTSDDGEPAYHVVVMDGITNARLDGFTITGGEADGEYWNARGGGIYCYELDDSNTIANCIITGNSANWDGGGVYFEGRDCSAIVTGCTISNNWATRWGGGVECGPYSSPTLTDCIISDNRAGHGGGLRSGTVGLGASPKLINCTIIGNSAEYAGGLDFAASTPLLTGCVIAGNWASESRGGVNLYGPVSTIKNCVISGNVGGDGGGGLYCGSEYTSVTNCIISGNVADLGGGIYLVGYRSLSITNCTIVSNSANTGGGCIFAGSVSFTNSILADNAPHAVCEGEPGISAAVANCLFYDNEGGDYYDYDTSSTYTGADEVNAMPEASANIEGDPLFVGGVTRTWTASPSYDPETNRTTLTDSAALFAEGELAGRLINTNTAQKRQTFITGNTVTTVEVVGDITGLSDSGDTYQIIDYHLRAGSLAIGGGTQTGAPSTDLDEEPRPFDTDYDIGADEFTDTDGDGLPDYWEADNGLDPTEDTGDNGADGDPDGDGLTNVGEHDNGTDPNDTDSDDDSLPDGWEVDNELHPDNSTGDNGADGDPDGDGYTNLEEYEGGYDPQLSAPVADFTATPVSGERPLDVQFTDQSTGATSWSWDFGDEYGYMNAEHNTSADQNPSHTYYFRAEHDFQYTVTLAASGPGGPTDSETKIGFIHVDQALPAEGLTYKTVIDDIKVTYSKPTCFACYNDYSETLLIAVWGDEPGVLNVIAGEDAPTYWASGCDIHIDAPDASLKKINLKGRPEVGLYVCGQVDYVKNFILKHGYVGDTVHYGPDNGLGSAMLEPPKKILIKWGAATAPLLGWLFPEPEYGSIPGAAENASGNLELPTGPTPKPFDLQLDGEEDELDDADFAEDSLAETKEAYVAEVLGVKVRYSKLGCDAYYDPDYNTLTIEISESDGNLVVKCTEDAYLDWGDHCDILIDTAESINTINLKGRAETQLHVCGEVGSVRNFKLKYGCVGNTDYFGPWYGLGNTSLAPPDKILIKRGWTTAPVLGVSY